MDPSLSHNRPFFGCFWGDFQPFPTPDSFHALVIDNPTFVPQQSGHSAVAIASVLAGQLNDPFGQEIFIISWSFIVPLGCARLPHHPTGSALRHIKGLNGLIDSFELPGLGDIHSPIFPAPAIIGLFAYFQRFAGLPHRFPLAEINFSFTQFGNDLLRAPIFTDLSSSQAQI